jgi:hypothetical protein
MTPAEAFAVIPLAAACADKRLQKEEAELLLSQLRGRSPYREMDPAAFGTMVSSLLLGLRDNRHALLEKAATLLSVVEQEEAFAFAAQMVHADRVATLEETSLLTEVAGALSVPVERLRDIEASFRPLQS